VGQEHGEFLPAVAGHDVAGADMLQEHWRRRGDMVAGLVAELVVESLEPVDVQHEQGEREPFPFRLVGDLGQELFQKARL